jgi:hypothetical protein
VWIVERKRINTPAHCVAGGLNTSEKKSPAPRELGKQGNAAFWARRHPEHPIQTLGVD